jgi:hypothetical protein
MVFRAFGSISSFLHRLDFARDFRVSGRQRCRARAYRTRCEIRAKLLEADAKCSAAVPGAEQESASFIAQYRRGWGNWRNY